MLRIGSTSRSGGPRRTAHDGTITESQALGDRAIEAWMPGFGREAAVLSRAGVADDHVGGEVVEHEVEGGGGGEAAVVRHHGDQGRRDHDDRDAKRGGKVLASVELGMATADAAVQAAGSIDPLGMERVLPRARWTAHTGRELSGSGPGEREDVRRVARAAHAKSTPGALSPHNGIPYERCSEIETAVPIRTSTVEA